MSEIEPGAAPTYAVVAGSGVVIWGTTLETWVWGVVTLLTIAVLVVRLCVDVPRALRKRKEPDR